MFKLIKSSSFGFNSLIKINCQTKSSINKTIIRTKRQTLSRRPVKVLTDSGKDYYRQYDYKESINSPDLELKPNVLNQKERKDYNKYFDEGFSDDFLTTDQTFDDNFNEFNTKTIKSKTNSNKNKEKLNENMGQNDNQFNDNKRQTNDSNVKKAKFETVLKPKISGIPVYQRLGDNNTEFINLISTQKSRKRRQKERVMTLEGKRLITDAIKAQIKIKTIFFTKEENLVGIEGLDLLVTKGLQLKKVLYRDVKLFSPLTTSPGVIAVCERPDNKTLISTDSDIGHKLPLILIADNVRDPGNLGTMVRCAAAVGVQKLLLLKGCADVWESKVLRSGAGAHFRVPIISDIEWPLIFNHIPIDRPFDLFIAESNDDFEQNNIINHRKDGSDIPSHTINTITKDFNTERVETVLRDDSYHDSNPELKKYKNSSIGSNTYCETKFYTSGIERPTVLVIGGETHGLSAQSYKLAYDYIGRKIKIPLALGVDSLNSAIASAVILYEMKRQFQCHFDSTDEHIQQNI